MALLNLILAALFAALGLFDTNGDGDGDGGDRGGKPADKPGGAAAGGDDDGGGDEPPDLTAEVAKWKALSRKHEAAAKTNADAARRLREAEDADKSELQKAQDAAATEKRRADEAEGRLLRLEIAAEKGLTPSQAKRLVGSTREELEADAEELLEAFGAKNGAGDRKEPLRRPTSKPRSGSVPDAEPEENDPIKLAAKVPRS